MRHRALLGHGLIALAALGLVWEAAHGQSNYPSRPVKMIVAVGAGGATDTLARKLAEQLSKSMGQPFIVENQPAASGMIAAQTVARAAPDGYTLLIGTNTTHAGNQAFIKSVPYDPITDFEPITRLGLAALLLGVNNDVPAKSVQELTAYAKAHPGKLAFGAGTGSARLATELYKAIAGIDLLSVPYKGNQQALVDLRGGQIQILFGDIALMQPQVKTNAVRGLAVSSAKRSAVVPDLPTMQEAGVPGYELVGWIAAFAPAKTPAPIVKRLNEEMNKALADKDLVETLHGLGVDAAPGTPDELRAWVKSETKKWGDLARQAGIQPE
ncbi:MAG TPA: tripartite tricarboxylate transporter substrate binding protein [Casimicrobiaceae bacterium]|nr:tripartite tricarboxylate transporter substrate binding protein [Casimicrobiaceae bacterium]